MKFSLHIAFTQTDLKSLFATGTAVVLSNPLDGLTLPNVAWLAFHPLEQNTVTWDAVYGLYASAAAVTPGAVLTPVTSDSPPLTIGAAYTFQPEGAFSPPRDIGLQRGVAILNQRDNRADNGYLTFGLNQKATVNERQISSTAVSAQGIVYQTAGTLIPSNVVFLWLQAGVVSNSVVEVVPGVLTRIVLPAGGTELSLTYQSNTGQFVQTETRNTSQCTSLM